MNRVFFSTLALWVLLLSPVLCLAGVLEHLCVACPENTCCDHEEDCAYDPCAEVLQVPDSAQGPGNHDRTVLLIQSCIKYDPFFVELPRFPNESLNQVQKNFPRPESDLPLLI